MNDRKFWIDSMLKIANPVLRSFAEETVRQDMPPLEKIDESGRVYRDESNAEAAYLEALGRTLAGIAPWLEVELPDSDEKRLQEGYRVLTRKALEAAVDPASPAKAMWISPEKRGHGQPLVDAAYVAHALLRAPKQLYGALDEKAKQNLIASLRLSGRISPCVFNNWMMFSAMIETALYKLTGSCDEFRIEVALARMDDWFLGTGVYGDGKHFSSDYYNSYVIHPMMDDITAETAHLFTYVDFGEQIRKREVERFARYCFDQIYMIAPDGTYPILGRSIVYRTGAFQALAQAALKEVKLRNISPAQIRRALTSLIKKLMGEKHNFDDRGWLRTGLSGVQPKLRDDYNSTGSFYMCELVFLPLGLAPDNAFWTMPEDRTPWEKLWSGEDAGR